MSLESTSFDMHVSPPSSNRVPAPQIHFRVNTIPAPVGASNVLDLLGTGAFTSVIMSSLSFVLAISHASLKVIGEGEKCHAKGGGE